MSEKYISDVFTELTLEITKFMSIPVTGNIRDTEAWVTSVTPKITEGSDFTVAITNKETDKFIGCGGLHDIDTNTPSLGIWIKKSSHGNHYGQEAIHALKNWADENIKYEYIKYLVAVRNIPSRKIPESLGGKVFRKYYAKNGAGEKLLIAEYRIYHD